MKTTTLSRARRFQRDLLLVILFSIEVDPRIEEIAS
jgi:hypothetical protein